MKKILEFIVNLFANVEEQEYETEDVMGYIVRQQMFPQQKQ